MLTTSRKALLLDRLAQDGQLMVTPLAREFGLSEDTLRRDMRELAAEGKLVRVHGGAIPASTTHQPVDMRRGVYDAEKARLAHIAASQINDGMTVIVDGGTTHMHLAAALSRDLRCTIVTHSPAIAASFEFHPQIEIVMIGGRIFRHSMVATGPEAARAFDRIRADLCLLGVTGVHPEPGLTTGDSEEAALKRVMIKAAGEVTVLATPDKIGHAGTWQIDTLAGFSTLISVGTRPDWLPDSVAHFPA